MRELILEVVLRATTLILFSSSCRAGPVFPWSDNFNCFIYTWQPWAKYWSLQQNRNTTFNPLSPNSDQYQFPPYNIHILSREQVMRINKVINKELNTLIFHQILSTYSRSKINVWRSVWRICRWIWSLND